MSRSYQIVVVAAIRRQHNYEEEEEKKRGRGKRTREEGIWKREEWGYGELGERTRKRGMMNPSRSVKLLLMGKKHFSLLCHYHVAGSNC